MTMRELSAVESNLRSGVVEGFWQIRAFVGLVILYYVLVTVVTHVYGDGPAYAVDFYFGIFSTSMILFCIGFLVYRMLDVMIRQRPDRLIAAILIDLKQYLTLPRVLPAVCILLIFPLFFSAFTSLKTTIPHIQAYSWDPAFAQLDRWLHGGVDPWRLLQPLLGHPRITTLVNGVYHLWYFVFYCILFWQAFSLRNPERRAQFLVSFVLLWIVAGSVFAVLFASAGPVYYGRITGLEDPFRELMDYLALAHTQSPVWALELQDRLWFGYEQGVAGFGNGISAMPSVHVALAVLLAILGWHSNRVLGWLLTVFALLIQIGSVHLGWHYAIDGYLGAILAFLLWPLAGWISRDRRRGPAEGSGP